MADISHLLICRGNSLPSFFRSCGSGKLLLCSYVVSLSPPAMSSIFPRGMPVGALHDCLVLPCLSCDVLDIHYFAGRPHTISCLSCLSFYEVHHHPSGKGKMQKCHEMDSSSHLAASWPPLLLKGSCNFPRCCARPTTDAVSNCRTKPLSTRHLK